MFDALSGIFSFVTVAVSFIYGVRIAWICGKRCHFGEQPEEKKHILQGNHPAAAAVFFFGFLIIFSALFDGFVTIVVLSLTSAILLSTFIISMAMPELKRRPKDR
ncbi:MAG: hypothetical protein P8Y96_07675 [Desulfuromonadales bacterium]|jgi:uncharacterized membrane protein SpoIIM required for sporulation